MRPLRCIFKRHDWDEPVCELVPWPKGGGMASFSLAYRFSSSALRHDVDKDGFHVWSRKCRRCGLAGAESKEQRIKAVVDELVHGLQEGYYSVASSGFLDISYMDTREPKKLCWDAVLILRADLHCPEVKKALLSRPGIQWGKSFENISLGKMRSIVYADPVIA